MHHQASDGVIRVDQRGIGNHRIQFLANGRFLPERIHLFRMLHQTGAQVSRQVGNGLSIRGNERLYVGIIAHHSGDIIVIAGIAGTIIAEQLSLQNRPGVPIFPQAARLRSSERLRTSKRTHPMSPHSQMNRHTGEC